MLDTGSISRVSLVLVVILCFGTFFLVDNNIPVQASPLSNDTDNSSNSMNYTYSELIPQIIPTGLQRIGGGAIESINNLDVDIAILDVGVSPHQDLNLFNRFNAIDPGDDYSVECKHGTHVAGIAGAMNNDVGIVGAAPGARIWDIRIAECDPETMEPITVSKQSFLNALDYIIEHSDEIDVVNISYNQYCPALCNAQIYENRVNEIIRRGVVVVASAGNDNNIAIQYMPPKIQSVITVSAISDSDGKCGGLGDQTSLGEDDAIAANSNYGNGVDIAAPGVEILSTIPGDAYDIMSGTSMAAPLVSGTAALIKVNVPGIQPDEIGRIIIEAGSNPDATCDGEGYGYFDDFKDESHEPMLYIKNFMVIK